MSFFEALALILLTCMLPCATQASVHCAVSLRVCATLPICVCLGLFRFKEVHAWVSVEAMLNRACLGELQQDADADAAAGADSVALPPGKVAMSPSEWTPCTVVEILPANEAGDMLVFSLCTPGDVVLVCALRFRSHVRLYESYVRAELA
jgi:hypothetical protein